MTVLKYFLLFGLVSLFARQAHAQDTLKINGTVKDARTGKPLTGIQVSVDAYAATLTDEKGHFIVGVPNKQVTLAISGIGYQAKRVALKGQSVITTSLYEEGFTTAGSSSLNTRGGWQAANETPNNYLQGKVSGLTVTRRSGTPGNGANLLLNGFSSLYASNQPLIIVDGVIYDNSHAGSTIIGGHYSNPLQDIDVKDIENISFIKDAVTTYGTKAANGVLQITTTHARELSTRIDFSAYEGVNFSTRKLPLMEAGDYRVYLFDLLKSGGYTDAQISTLPYMNDDPAAATYYQYHNKTNWQNEVLQNSRTSNYFLKVTGGDDIARYALSMGYGKNNGIIRNTGLTTYRTRFNADFNLSKKLTANTSLSFNYNEQKLKDQGLSPKTNPLYIALVKSPLLAPYDVNAEGVKSPNLAETDVFGVSNPRALIDNAQQADKNYRFFGLVNVNYAISTKLSIASTIGLTYDKIRENTFIPRKGVANDTLANAVADSRLGSRTVRFFSLYNDTRLIYSQVYRHIHSLNASIGFRYNSNNTEEDYALGYNSATDNLISVGTGVSALRVVGGDIGKSKWINTYAAADYNLYGKYFASLSLAADASSRFGKGITGVPAIGNNRLALLPAVGVSWLVSAEPFMAKAVFIDRLKLKASYGITGNDDIGNYDARRQYVSQNLLGMQGLVRGNVGNPYLQWEQVKKAVAGIDVALLHERLSISAEVYNNTTNQLITYEPLNAITGFDYVKVNGAKMNTSGINLQVNGRIVNRTLVWDAGILISKYKNKVTRLPQGSFLTGYADASYITQEGSTTNLFYGYRTNGIYNTNAQAAAAGYSITTATGAQLPFTAGDVQFEDRNGDRSIDENDRFVIGDPNPDFTGSISSTFSYKRWQLDVLFTFSQGNDVYNYTRARIESAGNYNNQSLHIVNRWRTEEQITNVPKATLGDPMGNARFSDRWIEDGSYLRLRTLALTYDLGLKKSFVRYAKIYATGNNLLTFTRYLGYDPEFSANNSVFSQGIDTGLEPLYRSVQLGIRVGL